MREGVPEGPCRVVRITDEAKLIRNGGDGEVSPASSCLKLPRWDVTAAPPLIRPQSSGFEAIITEASRSSLEKWNQRRKWSRSNSRLSRWDIEIVRKTSSTDQVEIAQLLPFPEDILVKILALLPLPKLLQLRLVCRWWDNRLLRTPHLWKSWASQQYCWFVMARKEKQLFAKEFVAYCITNSPQVGGRKTGHWLSLSPLLEAPQVAAHVGGKKALRVVCRHPQMCWTLFSLSSCLVAGAQGHVCFLLEHLKRDPPALEVAETFKYHSMVFEEGNPTPFIVDIVTGATEILPPPQSSSFFGCNAYMNMVFLPKASNAGYYIVLHSRTRGNYLEVFNSDTGSWRTVLDRETPSCRRVPAATSEVQSGDIFWLSFDGYPLSMSYNLRLGEPINGLRGYNVAADAWSHVSAGFPTDAHGAFAHITKHKGCLVLADLVDSPNSSYQYEKLDAVGIWVLQQSSASGPGMARWVQIARTPPEYWEDYSDIMTSREGSHLFVKFISFGSLICMTGSVLSYGSNYEGDYLTPLVYDLNLDSWYHLPAYEGGMDVMGLFALHPASPFSN